MKKIEFIPLKGAKIEGIQLITFGMSQNVLIEILGEPSKQFDNELSYEDLELCIYLDQHKNVELIEAYAGPYLESTEISIANTNPFTTSAEKLIEILTKVNSGEINKKEADHGFTFLIQSISVYRNRTQKESEDFISELKADGEYEEDKEYALFELEKSKYFWSISIGRKGYFE
jgi:hypothetical protein